MTDEILFTLLFNTLKAGFASIAVSLHARTGVELAFKQANQGRAGGTPSGPVVLLSNLYSHRHGSPGKGDAWDGVKMVHTEVQAMEDTLQCGALVPLPPSGAKDWGFTASDLVRRAATILQSDAGLVALRVGGVGIERIQQIRQPAFTDDKDRLEYSPSFDFTVTYNAIDVSEIPVVTAAQAGIYPV